MPPRRREQHRLSAQFVRTAPPGFHCDGHGLNLRVDPSGARRWVQRLRIRGRPRSLGLGGYPLVSLAEARDMAFTNRKLARAGGDPLAQERHRRDQPTVAEAADQVLAHRRRAWRPGSRHAQDWLASLRRYAYPRIGDLRVSEVTSEDVLQILMPIWHTKSQTARLVRHRISAVMQWAIAMRYRQDDPAGHAVTHALGRQTHMVRHQLALPYREVAAAIAAVQHTEAQTMTKLAFEFLVLTAARTVEVRLATWDEIDLRAAVWTAPHTHVKTKREHRVPLCDRAVAILRETAHLASGAGRPGPAPSGLIFPNPRGKPLSTRTFGALVTQRLGLPAVPHGFRSSFRDWAAEQTDHPREVIEAALAHTTSSKTEAAYLRSDLFDRRRRLMDDWAAYLSTGLTEAEGEGDPAREPASPVLIGVSAD